MDMWKAQSQTKRTCSKIGFHITGRYMFWVSFLPCLGHDDSERLLLPSQTRTLLGGDPKNFSTSVSSRNCSVNSKFWGEGAEESWRAGAGRRVLARSSAETGQQRDCGHN